MKGLRQIFCMMLMLAAALAAKADDIYRGQIMIMNYLSSGGYVEVKFPHYNDNGRDDGLHYNEWSYISINGSVVVTMYSFPGEGDPQSYKRSYWCKYRDNNSHNCAAIEYLTDDGHYRYLPSGSLVENDMSKESAYVAYSTLRIYPSVAQLATGEIKVAVHLYIDKNNGSDYSLDSSSTYSYAPPALPTPNISLSTDKAGRQNFTFIGRHAGDTYSYYDPDDGAWKSGEVKSDSQQVSDDFKVSNDVRELSIEHKLKLSEYQMYPGSTRTPIPAYFMPNEMTLTRNEDSDVLVEWEVSSSTYDQNNQDTQGKWIVERADNKDFKNAVEIYNKEISNKITYKQLYSTIDKTSDANLNGTFYYRIRRSNNQWGEDPAGYVMRSIDLEMRHRLIGSAHATADGSKVTVEWSWDGGNVWSKDSKVYFVRYNVTTKQREAAKALKDEQVSAKSFTDEMPTTCEEYKYYIYVEPGSSSYACQDEVEVVSDGPLFHKMMGHVTSIKASKGYYNDHVELRWTTDGEPVEFFSVMARIHSDDPANQRQYEQIASVTANISGTTFQYNDTRAVAGVVYDYNVCCNTHCTGEVMSEKGLADVGFRTPAGEINGRITYENGQAVEGVTVTTEADKADLDRGCAVMLTEEGQMTITNRSILADADQLTVQAWVNTSSTDGSLFEKSGMFALCLEGNKVVLKAGDQRISSPATLNEMTKAGNNFVHVSAVVASDSLAIYVYGEPVAKEASRNAMRSNNSALVIGAGLAGVIDEVRVWAIALDAAAIQRDYNRYIVGNEKGLVGYYTLDMATSSEFFDCSRSGIEYNENHGIISGGHLQSESVPETWQLGHRGVSNLDGSYIVRSIPYSGNGTTYMIVPTKGSHSFSATKELRTISSESSVYTVNFVDKSSFEVKGVITYDGGTVPVEGVEFKVDGKACIDAKNNIIKTNSRGEFAISVPIGTHEVRAEKAGHKFENDGRITNSDGSDRNYQDHITGIELKDITTIKLIGRVAGGTVQDKIDMGFGLSTNNLGDGVSLTLCYPNDRYTMLLDTLDVMESHFVPSFYTDDKPRTNRVVTHGNEVVIYPNKETGEFVAHVLPEVFNVAVNVPGYERECEKLAEEADFSGSIVESTSKHVFTDTIFKQSINRVDTIVRKYDESLKYNALRKYTLRVAPEIELKQLSSSGKPLDYFGQSTLSVLFDDHKNHDVELYNSDTDTYLLGRPVFTMGEKYTLQAKVHEAYRYYDSNGNIVKDKPIDNVPSQNAKVTFVCEPESKNPIQLEADSTGVAKHTFLCGVPDLESGISSVTVSASINGDASFAWEGTLLTGFITIGNRQKGTDFVTKGPDRLLTVLRDPPGSNSYSYLEKGATIKTSIAKKHGFNSDNKETAINEYDDELTVVSGAPGAAVIGKILQTSTDLEVGIVHSIEDTWNNRTETSTTFETRIATSSDPDYVGPMADLYVGYSTNLLFGSADNVNLIKREVYEKSGGANSKFKLFGDITPAESDFVLVRYTANNIGQAFTTMFAYPQCYIEDMLIPRMEELRNSMLHHKSEMSDSEFAELARTQGEAVYVSNYEPQDPMYATSNKKESIVYHPLWMDGNSYKVYYPDTKGYEVDTIKSLNNDIASWIKILADNEQTKYNAVNLVRNFSFQSGSTIEYSETYSYTNTQTHQYDITVGITGKKEFGTTIKGYGISFQLDETESYVHTTEKEEEKSSDAKIGFELADGDGYDYFSVDVLRECEAKVKPEDPDHYISSFVFKTRGGASMWPYEGEYVTKYWNPGKYVLSSATLQIEVPKIRLEKTFIDNVPSGEAAPIVLYLSNSSEMAGADCVFQLMLSDESNPDGLQLTLDGAGLGNGRNIYIPAGETVTKTLLARKATALNYDNIQLYLMSKCQNDWTAWNKPIYDLATFSVHFTPSATAVNIKKPNQNWIYNLNTPTQEVDGIKKHYLEVVLDGFDTDYDNFRRIMLQYKPASGGEDDWVTLMSYYTDQEICDNEIASGHNAAMIKTEDKGTIIYRWSMDELMDQEYDLRAVGTSVINNVEYTRASEVYHGLKDMEPLRIFGEPQPANGVLRVGDEIRLNFTKEIAKGYLSGNNFEVTGIRNGAKTDHSVAVSLDGDNDALMSESRRNFSGKDLTVEMWVNAPEQQNAVYFAHGDEHKGMEFGITADNKLRVRVGDTEVVSDKPVAWAADEWAHVALTLDTKGILTAYYNFVPCIQGRQVSPYNGNGIYSIGAKTIGGRNFRGKIHNVRIWDTIMSGPRIQSNSLSVLSGNELNLVAYYPMNEGCGSQVHDRAHSAHMLMGGAEWALPQGRAAAFNGKDQYVKLNTGTVPIDSLMDYSIELWFKAARANNPSATLIANGVGDGSDDKHSYNAFFLGFIDGVLTYRQNGVEAKAEGNWLDDNWHHLVLTVSRTSKRGQFVIDGKLNSYFSAERLGAIASPHMSVGARSYTAGWDTGTTTDKVDMYLCGLVDEVRLWNVYKSEGLVEKSINVQLDGDEKGLLAYYPFEHYIDWQGTKEMQFSLADARVLGESDTPVPDGVFVNGAQEEPSVDDHSAIASKLAAPVRGKGEVSKLDYDYVVNGDALIITLREDLNRIENTTVAFAVDGIRDINGNPLASPVMWTAFIDRNQLRWGENPLNDVTIERDWIEKDGWQFNVDVINEGGYNVNYTIANLPSWLKASPIKGKLNPTERQTIKFTITETINVGSYNELIYLIGDNDVTECMPFNLTVKAREPDWSVNPADYRYSMSVFGKIKIGNEYSADTSDILAAFDHDNCVGVTTTSYVEANDMYYALLTIYSNEVADSEFKFRIWDASNGEQYIAEPDRDIVFVNNSVIGDSYNPVIFSATDAREQNIALNQGWTWISVNVDDPSLADINKAIGTYAWSNDDIIKSETTNKAANYYDGKWVGPLAALDYTDMYHVKSATVSDITVVGANIDTKKSKLKIVGADKDGTPRWNYISYLPNVRMDVNRALSGYEASVGDIIKSQTAFAMYSGNLGWVGNLEYMEPGRGYMLKRMSTAAASLQYPEGASRSAQAPQSRADADSGSAAPTPQPQAMPYAGNMTIVAKVVGIDPGEGHQLAAYVNGQVRAEASISTLPDGRQLYFLAVPGDERGMLDLGLTLNGTPVAMDSRNQEYATNRTLGTVDNPYIINLGCDEDCVRIYPRPFRDHLSISVNADDKARVDVEIFNSLSQRLALFANCCHGGQAQVEWDARHLPSGVYMVAVSIDGCAKTYKVVKY